ncbi:hypothetical protein AMTRI_Chr03g45980 [Amborella trichopoda]
MANKVMVVLVVGLMIMAMVGEGSAEYCFTRCYNYCRKHGGLLFDCIASCPGICDSNGHRFPPTDGPPPSST